MLTRGGDCPGFKAVIRAVVRDGIDEFGDELVGFRDGRGLLDSSYIDLDIEEYERLGVLLGDPRA